MTFGRLKSASILSLVGTSLGLVTIILGIVALSTPTWIVIKAVPPVLKSTYSLFKRCNETFTPQLESFSGCSTLENFQAAQGLTIAGVVLAGLGILASIFLGVLIDNRWIHMLPQLLLITGPTLILVGGLLYVKNVLGNFSEGKSNLELGYSFVLILVTCIVGYISAVYFGFVIGFVHGHHHRNQISS
ncbi:unnamed protein product [Rotaria sp. Silwood1]|nr:unnamed protein product [Rotaria sp. Silwood1]CAF1665282.1 unnamed protein product [Rotaria sp. Silwood1]